MSILTKKPTEASLNASSSFHRPQTRFKTKAKCSLFSLGIALVLVGLLPALSAANDSSVSSTPNTAASATDHENTTAPTDPTESETPLPTAIVPSTITPTPSQIHTENEVTPYHGALPHAPSETALANKTTSVISESPATTVTEASQASSSAPAANPTIAAQAAQPNTALSPFFTRATSIESPASQTDQPADTPLLPRNPEGFEWLYMDTPSGAARIIGWSYKGAQTSFYNPVQTLVIPDKSPEGKPVVQISAPNLNFTQNMYAEIDFTEAHHLVAIGPQPQEPEYNWGVNPFSGSNLRGTLDLSHTAITSLNSAAFQTCPITSLKLPPLLTSIPSNAFTGDTHLTGDVFIPPLVTSIGNGAFTTCPITSLTLSVQSALTSIGSGAFWLTDIGSINYLDHPELVNTLPSQLTKVGENAFLNTQLPAIGFQTSQPIELGNSAFKGNKIANDPLSSYRFSHLGTEVFAVNKISGSISFKGVEEAVSGSSLVANNASITAIEISPHWAIIPPRLMYNNASLVAVSIPKESTILGIGESAFYNCTSLTSINFSNLHLINTNYGKAIGATAFAGCSALEEISFASINSPITTDEFITIDTAAFYNCTSLRSFVLPKQTPQGSQLGKRSITIGDSAFANTNLGSWKNPNDTSQDQALPLEEFPIISIGQYAFYHANLKEVLLPDTLQSIGAYAFAENHLPALNLPDTPVFNTPNPNTLGAHIAAGQTVDDIPLHYVVQTDTTTAELKMDEFALQTRFDLSQVTGASSSLGSPKNPEWFLQQNENPLFAYETVSNPGFTFTLNFDVVRKNGGTQGPKSTGDITIMHAVESLPVTFYYYTDDTYTDLEGSFVQYIPVGNTPQEVVGTIGNFGRERYGYYIDPTTWRKGEGSTGPLVDPSTQMVSGKEKIVYSAYWTSKLVTIILNDNFDLMVAQDPRLGESDPNDPTRIIPNPRYFPPTFRKGLEFTWEPGAAFTEAILRPSQPPDSRYRFVGWAIAPDLPKAERKEGINYLHDIVEGDIFTPNPIPKAGSTITLYAQYDPLDLTELVESGLSPITGFITIPRNITLKRTGGYLQSYHPSALDAEQKLYSLYLQDYYHDETGNLQVGVTWSPSKMLAVYAVPPNFTPNTPSLELPDHYLPLISISTATKSDTREIEVLDEKGNLYNPTIKPDGEFIEPSKALATMLPQAKSTQASFFLRSVDPARMFEEGQAYTGEMYFYVRVLPAS